MLAADAQPLPAVRCCIAWITGSAQPQLCVNSHKGWLLCSFRQVLEPLMYKYGVDLVYNGHVRLPAEGVPHECETLNPRYFPSPESRQHSHDDLDAGLAAPLASVMMHVIATGQQYNAAHERAPTDSTAALAPRSDSTCA